MARLLTSSGEGLSEQLACLDLGGVDAAEVTSRATEEAARLLGGEAAAVWIYREALGRLFYERDGAEPAAVTVTEHDMNDLLSGPSSWTPASGDVRGRLIEASFGLAAGRRKLEVLAVPLTMTGELLGLALVARETGYDAGALPEVIESFARQTAAVLLNHQQLQRAQQNEVQLQALFETASELTSNLDLEAVLTAIVERARAVVDAPISYIMLVDDAGDQIAMRVTVGTKVPEFAGLELKLGGGLGGQVAASKRALYTSDYLDDGRFEHVPEVDAAVRDESVRSILGAPMNLSDRFIGVLFVADRAVRAFTDAEVGLVSTLANHAATAIHNAELYDRVRGALAELAASDALMRAQNRRLERADQLHAELSQAVLAGRGLGDIVRLVEAVIGGHVLVFDHHHQLLARAGDPCDAFGRRLISEGPVRAGAQLPELRRLLDGAVAQTLGLEPSGPDRTMTRLVVPIIARAELLGSVWLELRAEDSAEARPLIEQATRVVALELLKERAIAEVHRRLGRELLDDLLVANPTSDEGLSRRAAELGVDVSRPHRLIRVAFAPWQSADDPSVLGGARDASLGAFRRQPWCRFAGGYAQGAVALADASCDDPVARVRAVLTRALPAAVHAQAAISPPCERVQDYRPHFVAAGRALELMSVRQQVSVVDLGEAWVLTLLFRNDDGAELRRFVQAQLGPLLEHDEEHGLGLVETLESYLDSEQSPTRTATVLHVHVNTVYYRLERVKALLGENFVEARRALDLRVALLAYRLLFQSRTSTTLPGAL